MSSFTSPLVVSVLPDGKRWRLVRPFTYHLGSEFSRTFIRVSRDFLTDWASIPKFIFWLLPWWAKFNKSAILHDWLYQMKRIMGKPITRKEADNVWLGAMLIEFRHHKHGMSIAYTKYYAVRIFGWLAW